MGSLVSRVSVMILGLLMEEERHGYDLVKEMGERGMLRWTGASKVAVYKSLASLEREGCLVSWVEKSGNSPERRVYTVTVQGEERLRDLVYDLCSSQEHIRFETSIGLTFITYLKEEEAREALERRLQYIEEQVRRLARERDIMEGLDGDMYTEILEHELAVYKGEARWLKLLAGKTNSIKKWGRPAITTSGDTRKPPRKVAAKLNKGANI
jgi:DNA-binding PadR family transcriptional regulator